MIYLLTGLDMLAFLSDNGFLKSALLMPTNLTSTHNPTVSGITGQA